MMSFWRVTAAVLLLVAVAHGRKSFQALIPNGDNVPHPCVAGEAWPGVGHQNPLGGGALNPFGEAFKAAGFQWTTQLCRADTDGDGRTNGQELGDPNCIWTPGQTPTITDRGSLSHPGVCDAWDSANCTQMNSWGVPCVSTQFSCPAVTASGVLSKTMQFPRTKIPAERTNYFCMTFDFPADQDYHMIASQAVVDNPEVMHHILMYGCEEGAETIDAPQSCGMSSESCRELIGMWTVGHPGQCLYEEAGFRIGRNGIKRVLLEYHWNNADVRDDLYDGTGFTIYYTPNLRPNDAGVFWTGQTDLEIFPNLDRKVIYATCGPDCTSRAFRAPVKFINGINHMHYLGREQYVELRRNGEKVRHLTNESNFDYNSPYVYTYRPPVEVGPGDTLITTCVYESNSRTKTTHYGPGTHDEMCFGLFTYFPKENAVKSFCSNWRDINYCAFDGEVYQGCDTSIGRNSSHPEIKTLIDLVLENCNAFGSCRPECPGAIKRVQEHACFRGSAAAMTLAMKGGSSDARDVRFAAAMRNCMRDDDDDWTGVYPNSAEFPLISLGGLLIVSVVSFLIV